MKCNKAIAFHLLPVSASSCVASSSKVGICPWIACVIVSVLRFTLSYIFSRSSPDSRRTLHVSSANGTSSRATENPLAKALLLVNQPATIFPHPPLYSCHPAPPYLPLLLTIHYKCLYLCTLSMLSVLQKYLQRNNIVYIFLHLTLFLIRVVMVFAWPLTIPSLFLANRASILLKFPFLRKGEPIPMSKVNTSSSKQLWWSYFFSVSGLRRAMWSMEQAKSC